MTTFGTGQFGSGRIGNPTPFVQKTDSESAAGAESSTSTAAESGADTASTAESVTGAQRTDSDTGASAEALSRDVQGTDTAQGADAGTAAGTFAGSDTGGTAESVAAASKAGTEAATAAEAVGRSVTATEAAHAADVTGSLGMSGADQVAASDALTRRDLTSADSSTSTEAMTRRAITSTDARTVTESTGTQGLVTPTAQSGSDTATGVDAASLATPGGFTTIPAPRVWNNGDDLSAGTLNKEWRDAFRFLLGYTRPAFSAYYLNTSYAYTAGTPIPLVTELLKRGNLTHAASSTKVYVWETGWYTGAVKVGGDTTGISAGGTLLTSVVMVNGVQVSTCDSSRKAGGFWTVGHLFSIPLVAGDYVEIAVDGSWSGTFGQPSAGDLNAVPRLDLMWRTS